MGWVSFSNSSTTDNLQDIRNRQVSSAIFNQVTYAAISEVVSECLQAENVNTQIVSDLSVLEPITKLKGLFSLSSAKCERLRQFSIFRMKSFRSQRKERAKLRRQAEPRKEKHELQVVYESLEPSERVAFAAERRRLKEDAEAELKCHLIKCMQCGDPAIVFNCGFNSMMDGREITSLAKQLLMCYSSVKRLPRDCPVAIHLTELDKQGELWTKLLKQGAANLHINVHDDEVTEVFRDRLSDIVVLSPDATTELIDVERGKIYVIGGIVDRTVKTNVSRAWAHQDDIKTYRLPLSGYAAKKVLNITTVFDILLKKLSGCSWDEVMTELIPPRQATDETRKARMLQRKRDHRLEIFPDHDPLIKDSFKKSLPVTNVGVEDLGLRRLFRM